MLFLVMFIKNFHYLSLKQFYAYNLHKSFYQMKTKWILDHVQSKFTLPPWPYQKYMAHSCRLFHFDWKLNKLFHHSEKNELHYCCYCIQYPKWLQRILPLKLLPGHSCVHIYNFLYGKCIRRHFRVKTGKRGSYLNDIVSAMNEVWSWSVKWFWSYLENGLFSCPLWPWP